MATFTSSSPGNPNADPNQLFNLGQDLQTAQGIQGTSQKLAYGQQALADQQQEVGLRDDVSSSDPSVSGPALNQLAGIDPAAATAQLQYKTTQASLPLQRAQALSNFEATGLRAVMLSPNSKSAYEQQYVPHMTSMGFQVPPTYDPNYVTSGALAGLSPDQFIQLQKMMPQYGAPLDGTGGGSAGGGAGPTSGAPSPTDGSIGLTGPQGPASAAGLGDGGLTPDQSALFNAPLTPGDGVGAPQATPADLASMGGVPGSSTPAVGPGSPPPGTNQLADVGLSATPPGGYTPGAPGDQVSAAQPDAGSIDVTASGGPPAPAPPVAAPSAPAATPTYADEPTSHALSGTNVQPGFRPQLDPTTRQPIVKDGVVTGMNPDGTVGFALTGSADPHVQAVKAQMDMAAKNGLQLIHDPNTNLSRYVPIPGVQQVLTQNAFDQAHAKTLADGPIPAAGPGQLPPDTVPAAKPPVLGNTPALPLPPNDPYAGLPNNADTEKQMSSDYDAVQKEADLDAPVIEEGQKSLMLARQYMALNKNTATGPYANSELAAIGRSVPWLITPNNAPLGILRKISQEQLIAGLPRGVGQRLDLPIVRAVAAQQPTPASAKAVSDNINNTQIGLQSRHIAYLQAKSDFGQQNRNFRGFDTMWNAYSNNVPTLTWAPNSPTLNVQPNDAAPSFHDWAVLRSDPTTGRFDPSKATIPDAQLIARTAPAQQPGTLPAPTDMRQAASPPPAPGPMQTARYAATHPDETSGLAKPNPLAALEGHVVQQGGRSFLIQNGQAIPQ